MDVKCSVYIAASVDGFIARGDGDISWLERPEYASAGVPGLTYIDFISTVDVIVMGRNTFEKVLTFGFWPYEDIPVTVLTSRTLNLPYELQEKVSAMHGTPDEIVSRLAADGKKHLYIDGGATIQRFLNDGLIDEMIITTIPVLLGDGIPLFGKTGRDIHLVLKEVSHSANGFVQNRYSVK